MASNDQMTKSRNMNKDLILREYLAIERTKMANQRTLLTYIRTGLYFFIAGSTLGELLDTTFWRIMGTPLIIIGLMLMITGLVLYKINQTKINKSLKQVGHIKAEFLNAIGVNDEP